MSVPPPSSHTDPVCNYETDAGTGHSTILGVSGDGYGIYGKFETLDQRPCDLDVCHGHVGAVPATTTYGVAAGTYYHYHVSDADTYPYTWTMGCYGDPATPVTLATCESLYDGCGIGGDTATIITDLYPSGKDVKLWCPCFEVVPPEGCSATDTPTPDPQPGYYWDSATATALPCPASTASPYETGASDISGCVACNQYQYSEAGANFCSSAPAGTIPNEDRTGVVDCPANTFSEGATDACTNCLDGQTSDPGSAACDNPPDDEVTGGTPTCTCGSYQDSAGTTLSDFPEPKAKFCQKSTGTCYHRDGGATSIEDECSTLEDTPCMAPMMCGEEGNQMPCAYCDDAGCCDSLLPEESTNGNHCSDRNPDAAVCEHPPGFPCASEIPECIKACLATNVVGDQDTCEEVVGVETCAVKCPDAESMAWMEGAQGHLATLHTDLCETSDRTPCESAFLILEEAQQQSKGPCKDANTTCTSDCQAALDIYASSCSLGETIPQLNEGNSPFSHSILLMVQMMNAETCYTPSSPPIATCADASSYLMWGMNPDNSRGPCAGSLGADGVCSGYCASIISKVFGGETCSEGDLMNYRYVEGDESTAIAGFPSKFASDSQSLFEGYAPSCFGGDEGNDYTMTCDAPDQPCCEAYNEIRIGFIESGKYGACSSANSDYCGAGCVDLFTSMNATCTAEQQERLINSQYSVAISQTPCKAADPVDPVDPNPNNSASPACRAAIDNVQAGIAPEAGASKQGPCAGYGSSCPVGCQQAIDNIRSSCDEDGAKLVTVEIEAITNADEGGKCKPPDGSDEGGGDVPDHGDLECLGALMALGMGIPSEENADPSGVCASTFATNASPCATDCQAVIDSLSQNCPSDNAQVQAMLAFLPTFTATCTLPPVTDACMPAMMVVTMGMGFDDSAPIGDCAQLGGDDPDAACPAACQTAIDTMFDQCGSTRRLEEGEEGEFDPVSFALMLGMTTNTCVIPGEIAVGDCMTTAMKIFVGFTDEAGEEPSGPCVGAKGADGTCSAECEALMDQLLDGKTCKLGDAMVPGLNYPGETAATVQMKTMAPRCFDEPSNEPSEPEPDPTSEAPTMAPIRIVVEAEIEIVGMTEDKWNESGESAFKKGVSKAAGCEEDDVKIIRVIAKEGRRLRALGVGSLEVEFEVDVTAVVAKQVKEAGVEEGKEDETEDNLVGQLVADVGGALTGAALKEEMEEATGLELEDVVVTEQPGSIEREIVEEDRPEDADVWGQGGGLEHFFDCYENKEGGATRCAGVYAGGGAFVMALFFCVFSVFCKLFSSDERRARANKKHYKAKASRKGREFEMPNMRDSSMSSAGVDDFEGVNPMGSKAAAKAGPGGGGREKKSDWIELMDEGSGRSYYENLNTGETSWSPPKEGFRNRLDLLAEKKRAGK